MNAKELWDARYLLTGIQGALERATSGLATMWRGEAARNALIEAASSLGDVLQHLNETEIDVKLDLLESSERWASDASVPQLRADRDRIVMLIGVIDHYLDKLGADEKQPDASWFPDKEESRRWDRVKNERGKVRKVTGAG